MHQQTFRVVGRSRPLRVAGAILALAAALPAHGLTLDTFVNGDDADTPPGPVVPVGTGLVWTYVVTNVLPDTLNNVVVTDSQGIAVTCPVTTLPPGASMTCTAASVASAGQTSAVGNVTAELPGPQVVAASDPTHYFGAQLDDMSITVTDGVAAAIPGTALTYTIVVFNAGPDIVPGALVTDVPPPALAGAAWTCAAGGGASCTAAGSGAINDPVTLPPGGTVTYTLTGTVAPGATGVLTNTATVTPPGGFIDPNPANDTATDTAVLTPVADLAITKSDAVATAVPGGAVTYTIAASNAGPSDAPGAAVSDALPAILTGATWTCAASGGASCTASGSGDIADTVALPAGASVTYTLTATVAPGATGTLANTAGVTPGGVPDPNPGNDTATDTDTIGVAPTTTAIPTLSEYGLALLAVLLAGLGAGRLRRGRGVRNW